MSKIQSSADHLTVNADGAGKNVIVNNNGVTAATFSDTELALSVGFNPLGITETFTAKSADFTPDLSTEGTIYHCTGTLTMTVPTSPTGTGTPDMASMAGKAFTVIHNDAAGTLSFGGTILWSGGTAGAPSGISIYTFFSDGTSWYGMEVGTGFA